MPGFAAVMGESDVRAVTAFLKRRLPISLRVVQASRNPGAAGLPPGAAANDWVFAPDCDDLHPSAGRTR